MSKRNSIQASIFKKNILATHPSIHCNVYPTQQATHTSRKSNQVVWKIFNHFAGDSHQLEPICSTESELLFSSKSSQRMMAVSMPSLF